MAFCTTLISSLGKSYKNIKDLMTSDLDLMVFCGNTREVYKIIGGLKDKLFLKKFTDITTSNVVGNCHSFKFTYLAREYDMHFVDGENYQTISIDNSYGVYFSPNSISLDSYELNLRAMSSDFSKKEQDLTKFFKGKELLTYIKNDTMDRKVIKKRIWLACTLFKI